MIATLNEILEQIETSDGPLTTRELARRLDIEESALIGMLEFLQRKGRIQMYRPGENQGCVSTSCVSCVFAGNCHQEGEHSSTGS